eukprot:scaffold33028_cov32-Tisochrysis_lutea.AAC.1
MMMTCCHFTATSLYPPSRGHRLITRIPRVRTVSSRGVWPRWPRRSTYLVAASSRSYFAHFHLHCVDLLWLYREDGIEENLCNLQWR